jgi:predicted aldo/keto reductase-like oxidoreductase
MSLISARDFLILGSSRFHTLTQLEVNKFLDYAQLKGINKIDTAPLYKSEEMIGNYHKNNEHFIVTTKLPIPFYGDTLKQVRNSLDRIRINKIQCLFTHGISTKSITPKLMSDLYFLKQQNIINEIGFSGANFTEKELNEKGDFTSLMITFNALDVGAYDLISTTSKIVYIKRPLANFIFDHREINNFKNSIKKILRKRNPIDQNSYEFRFNIVRNEIQFSNNRAEFFFKFLISHCSGHKYCVGISSKEHLENILLLFNYIDDEATQNLKIYFERIKELTKYYKFIQLT